MHKFWVLFIFLLFSFISFSQVEKKFNVNTDIDIVKVYLRVFNDGYGTPSIYKDLANAYYFRREYTESKKWFEKLFSEEKTIDETLLYRYKQSLKALKLYTEENVYFSVSGTN